MEWHTKDIFDAVNTVKQSKKFLLVFIRDNTDESNTFKSNLEVSESVKKFSDRIINIEIDNSSVSYSQFTAYYKVDNIPCLVIISHDGIQLHVIDKLFDDDDLNAELSKCIKQSEELNKSETENKLNSNDTVVDQESSSRDDLQQRIALMQSKLQEKRASKEEEERLKEKQREIERRELGKKLTEIKMTKKEIEEKELRDELKRKKLEEKEARDKILRQIEEDKKERLRIFKNNTIETSNIKPEVTQRSHISTSDGNFCRLQFRFPDGSSINNTFESADLFEKVVEFVRCHIQNNYGSNYDFELVQFFPKRTLGSDDYSKTLLQLELNPSASFAVHFLNKTPKNLSNQVSNTNRSIVSLILLPLNMFVTMLYSFFQWGRGMFYRSGTTQNTRSTNREATPNATVSAKPELSNKVQMDWAERQKRLLAAESRNIKKDGNMATFTDNTNDANKDDDDEARWNGNSTQQW